MFKPKKIIAHHSLTKDSETVSCGAIRNYHINTLGWSDIGYHAVVEFARDQYEVFFGRPWDIPGAHTKGHNGDSLGICFIGNYDEQPPSDRMLEVGAKIIKFWMRLYGISEENIYRHHDFAPYKTCPGKLFDILRLRDLVKN